MRLAGVPDDNSFLDQVAPKTERGKDQLGETRGHDADRA
jgi:hypothetical protein